MSLCLQDDGPEFPGQLVDAIMRGDVVFLCGSGVSSPQLPSYEDMVVATFERLRMEMSPPECEAFKNGRYEEVLGSLKRRLSDPREVTRAVSEILSVPDSPCLDNHGTILRLSRSLDNRVAVVTTNFDTLFERAWESLENDCPSRKISFAGQTLPAPGRTDFAGIVHIHGRLADPALHLDQSQLILISSDYGEAYMRSGWASRFFFDLIRCKHIVLVGYSASDVPIRYMLSVLETDRKRFLDPHRVFALDGHKGDEQRILDKWDLLAVQALPYRIRSIGSRQDHDSLWCSLNKLADFVERPNAAYKTHVRRLLGHDRANSSHQSRKEVAWLLSEPRNLWKDALDSITDPAWFDFLWDSEGVSNERIPQLAAAWVRRNWQSADRFQFALQWQRKAGKPFTDHVAKWLRTEKCSSAVWSLVWRLFCLAEPNRHGTHDSEFYRAERRLQNEVILDSDLRSAIGLLTPKLELQGSPCELEANGPACVLPLYVLLQARLYTTDRDGTKHLAKALSSFNEHSVRILELTTAELRSALELEKVLGRIGDEHDRSDSDVPSVDAHRMNALIDGKNILVQLLSAILPESLKQDHDQTLHIVRSWKHLPGRLGIRLYLHAMRQKELFSADDAINTLLSLTESQFWRTRRELALLIKDRSGEADRVLLGRLEERILNSYRSYERHHDLSPENSDWRIATIALAAWLRLKMLEEAGALSLSGTKTLHDITKRYPDLDRKVEDHDFFDSYVSKPRFAEGSPEPIAQVEASERLEMARQMSSSHDIDDRQNWSAYCKSNPRDALLTLTQKRFDPADMKLWDQLLWAWAGDEEQKASLRVQALEHLFDLPVDVLRPMVPAIAYMIRWDEGSTYSKLDDWLCKLWEALVYEPESPIVPSAELVKRAAGTTAGQISEMLLLRIEDCKRGGTEPTTQQIELLEAIAGCPSGPGLTGCAVLARYIWSITHWKLTDAIAQLIATIAANTQAGKALRAVFLQTEQVRPEVTTLFKDAILKGIRECNWDKSHSQQAAAWIIRPALAQLKDPANNEWSITISHAAQALRDSCAGLRKGALDVLSRSVKERRNGLESSWQELIVPFFREVWPKEAKYVKAELSGAFVKLACSAGEEFPEALRLLTPFMSPVSDDGRCIWLVMDSVVPEKFPRETLELLWTVCGHPHTRHSYDLPKLLDKLLSVDPELEADRRFQWFELQAERF
ncbi:MAG: SIR2 family protein [Bacteroidota bacterium]|nr:SIR2 family protein [Bacteroidota bacterium]